MANKNILGLVFASACDDAVREMTSIRTMGSIPFSGRYRLIDFVLSNMVNCGVTKVGVVTRSNYKSLMDHVGSGKAWDLSRKNGGMTILPPYNLGNGVYSSRIEALNNVMNYIKGSNADYVIMSDCNTVCNLDFGRLIEYHVQNNADITLALANGNVPRLENTMVAKQDEQGRITEISVSPKDIKSGLYSMNIFVISRVLLERLINDAVSMNQTHFEKDVIQANVEALKIFGYEVKDYVKTIDSLQSYYEISMDLVDGDFKKLFKNERPVYTKVRDNMPSTYGLNSQVNNSLIADGCIIKGKVENCILFRGARVEEGATVKNSIIMQGAYIGAGAKVNYAILDKNAVLKPLTEMSGAKTYPIYVGKSIVV